MAWTPTSAFKLGFLVRCAEEGLAGAQVRTKIAACREKQALLGLGIKDVTNAAATIAKTLGTFGIAGSMAGGAGAGYLAAKMTGDDIAPEELQQQELLAAYKYHAERARREAAARQMRIATQ